jgi:hypothetical protein
VQKTLWQHSEAKTNSILVCLNKSYVSFLWMVTKVAIQTSTIDVHAFVRRLCVDYFPPKCSKHLSIQMKKNIIL